MGLIDFKVNKRNYKKMRIVQKTHVSASLRALGKLKEHLTLQIIDEGRRCGWSVATTYHTVRTDKQIKDVERAAYNIMAASTPDFIVCDNGQVLKPC